MPILLSDIWNTSLIQNEIASQYNLIMLATSSDNPEYVSSQEAQAIELWVRKYCHNILTSPTKFDDNAPQITLENRVAEVITHNIILLVNEWRNIIKLADLDQGKGKTDTSTNPYRSDTTGKTLKGLRVENYDYFEIMERQGKQMAQAHGVLKDIYKELELMLYVYN